MRDYVISSVYETNMTNENGIHQDSVIAYDTDHAGRVWAVLGHSNLGGISVWCGNDLCSLEKQYPAKFLFELGEAGAAFHAVPYPDGPASRGQIWPCGLWIQPDTNRFYCFLHNETGWGAGKTSYTVNGLEEGEPDFRHIGLMRSDDHGKTWTFVGWILTAHEACWTEEYRADMQTPGQQGDEICLGCGDFSIYAEPKQRQLYLFYTMHTIRKSAQQTVTDTIFLARCSFADIDDPNAWRKYTGENFSEPGNCGMDTAILHGGAIPSVCRDEKNDRYILSSYNRDAWRNGSSTCQLSFSRDLLHWTRPERISLERSELSNPYLTIVPNGQNFHVFMSSNGTGLRRFSLEIIEEAEKEAQT